MGFLITALLAFIIAFTIIFLDRYDAIATFILRPFAKNKTPYTANSPPTSYWRRPAFWSLVLRKNLLSLSDTQLLTGIAIQFTAMLQHCSLSIYHFQIVVELAFLTSVTHLLTVVALRTYFVKNRWINLPRILFMLGNLGLLGYTSFVAYSYNLADVEYAQRLDSSASLACFFQRPRPRLRAAFGGKWAGLLVGAIGSHATVILAMYVLPEEHKRGIGEWSWRWLSAIIQIWVIAPAYAVYGIVSAVQVLSTTQALGTPNVTIIPNEVDEETWGFGQFLPVLLLGLPLFAGWESFWEEYHMRDLKEKAMEYENLTAPSMILGNTPNIDIEEKATQNLGLRPIAVPTLPPIRMPSSSFTLDTETIVGSDVQIAPTATANLQTKDGTSNAP
jgi:hypothetical protein